MQLIAAILLLLQAVISVHTELVAVPVIVTGARGQRVSGLMQENFFASSRTDGSGTSWS